MNVANRVVNDEGQVRGVIDSWVQALRAKDVDGLVKHYAADVRSFDIAPPLQSRGTDATRAGLKSWFQSWRGPIGYKVSDLDIVVSGDVMFCTSINRLTGSRTDGTETDVWLRVTAGFRRTGGNWLIVHEHVSVPFYMDGSLKAAVDLKP
jgi:PhnB protein